MIRKFTDKHEWVTVENGIATAGITDFAKEALGDIVYVELTAPGAVINQGKPFGSIESVKAVSELYAPLSGTITEVNEALEDAPELLNENAYENWIIKIAPDDEGELSSLMDEEEYKEFCKNNE